MAAVCTLLPVAGYACLAGAELATMRSLLMVTVGLSAIWLGQERRLFHALSAAAMVILLHDPQALFDISFQLSFLSVIAMAGWLSWSTVAETEGLLNTPTEPSFLRTCIRWGRDSMVMSGVVTLLTIPLVAYYFNQLPWLGLFTNVLAVPVMGILLVPIGLVSAILADRGRGSRTAPGCTESVVARILCGCGPFGIDATGRGMACRGPFGSHHGAILWLSLLLWQRVGGAAFRWAAGVGSPIGIAVVGLVSTDVS